MQGFVYTRCLYVWLPLSPVTVCFLGQYLQFFFNRRWNKQKQTHFTQVPDARRENVCRVLNSVSSSLSLQNSLSLSVLVFGCARWMPLKRVQDCVVFSGFKLRVGVWPFGTGTNTFFLYARLDNTCLFQTGFSLKEHLWTDLMRKRHEQGLWDKVDKAVPHPGPQPYRTLHLHQSRTPPNEAPGQ